MPKQFIPLIGTASTFQETIMRVDAPIFDKPIVVTNHDYRFLVREQLEEIGAEAKIVIEPSRRDSGPAVAVAAESALRTIRRSIVAVFAADHVMLDQKGFLAACATAAAAAEEGFIVTLGVTPTEPAIGYGYIRPGGRSASGRARSRCVRREARARHRRTLRRGGLSLEFGQFLLSRRRRCSSELRAFEPEMVEAAEAALDGAAHDLGFLALDAEAFGSSPKKSIDYAVMERTTRAAVVPADIGWSDVGNWDAVWKLSPRDAQRKLHPRRRLRPRVEERPYPLGRVC